MTGYIYSIAAGDHVKIGYSKDPEQRLKQIATGCPVKPEIIALCKGTMRQEKAIHAALVGLMCHSSGEWYEKKVIKDVIACLKFHDAPKAIVHAQQISFCSPSKDDMFGRKAAVREFSLKSCCWATWDIEVSQGHRRLSKLEKHIKVKHGFSRREARNIVCRMKDELISGNVPNTVTSEQWA